MIDRLWPRGVKKENAKIDLWLKNIAPTTKLRLWFNHEPIKFDEFRRFYCEELSLQKETTQEIIKYSVTKNVTLIYAARDQHCNHALVLRDYLLSLET